MHINYLENVKYIDATLRIQYACVLRGDTKMCKIDKFDGNCVVRRNRNFVMSFQSFHDFQPPPLHTHAHKHILCCS